jgi:hypothetical protein
MYAYVKGYGHRDRQIPKRFDGARGTPKNELPDLMGTFPRIEILL